MIVVIDRVAGPLDDVCYVCDRNAVRRLANRRTVDVNDKGVAGSERGTRDALDY